MNRSRLYLIFMCFVLGAPCAVMAEDGGEVTAAVRLRHIYASDIEATDTEIAVTKTEFDGKYELKLFDELPVEVSLGLGHIDIGEDDPVDVPSHLESRRLGLSTKFPAPFIEDDRYFMGVDIFPTLNTDAWEWEPGAFRVPSRAYFIFKESDDFILVGGVSARPEHDNAVLPVLGMIYRPNERLSFNLAQDHPNITYQWNEATKLLMEFDYAFDEYEVNRGTQRGVVLKYRECASGFGIEHQWGEGVAGALSAGAVFNRRLEYKDGAGKIAPDTGVYVSLKLTAVF
jgi:hypothetical protein